MTPLQRMFYGALGGATPVLINAMQVDATVLGSALTGLVLAAYAVRVFAMLAVGAIVSWLNDSETKPIRAFQIGIVAPALLTQMLNGSALNGEAVAHAAVQSGAVQSVQRPVADAPAQVLRGLLGWRYEPQDTLVVAFETPTEWRANDALDFLRRGWPSVSFRIYRPAPELGMPSWMVTVGGQMTLAEARRTIETVAVPQKLNVNVRTILGSKK